MPLGSPRIHYAETTSTNDRAWEQARRGAPEGTLITADYQTQGRGRRGRRWSAPPRTSLLFSVLLYPRLPFEQTSLLTLAGGIAAARAIQVTTGLNARLKWPNDVLLNGRKVGGVLTETEWEGPIIARAVLGVGLNVNVAVDEWPSELHDRATSLLIELGQPVSREVLLKACLQELETLYEALRQPEGRATVLTVWRSLDVTRGQWVQREAGEEKWRGRSDTIFDRVLDNSLGDKLYFN